MRTERIRQGGSKADRRGWAPTQRDLPRRLDQTRRLRWRRPAARIPTTWRSSARAGRRSPPRSPPAARTVEWSWWSATGSVGPASTPAACRPRRCWPPQAPATSLPRPASASPASPAPLARWTRWRCWPASRAWSSSCGPASMSTWPPPTAGRSSMVRPASSPIPPTAVVQSCGSAWPVAGPDGSARPTIWWPPAQRRGRRRSGGWTWSATSPRPPRWS